MAASEILLPVAEYDLAATLDSGQVFRWSRDGEIWSGVLGRHFLTLTQTERGLRARAAALKQLAPQIEAALGPERYADYQQAIDPNYQQVFQLVTGLELPRTAAKQVVAVQKDIQQRTNALTADATLTPEQRQAQFAALNQEATAKLMASLGAAGLDAYKNGPGYWLQTLQQSATTPAAPSNSPAPPSR